MTPEEYKEICKLLCKTNDDIDSAYYLLNQKHKKKRFLQDLIMEYENENR